MAGDERKQYPWFRTWAKDRLTEEDFLYMNAEQRGILYTLNLHYWIKGSVPSDAEKIARLCNATPEAVKGAMPLMGAYFTTNGSGRLENQLLDAEYRRCLEESKRQSKKGKKGGRPRNEPEDDETDLQETQETKTCSKATVKPLKSQSESESETESYIFDSRSKEKLDRLMQAEFNARRVWDRHRELAEAGLKIEEGSNDWYWLIRHTQQYSLGSHNQAITDLKDYQAQVREGTKDPIDNPMALYVARMIAAAKESGMGGA